MENKKAIKALRYLNEVTLFRKLFSRYKRNKRIVKGLKTKNVQNPNKFLIF